MISSLQKLTDRPSDGMGPTGRESGRGGPLAVGGRGVIDKFYGDSQKLASQVTFLTICIQQPKQRSQLKPHSYIRYQHTIFTYQFLVLHYSGEYY